MSDGWRREIERAGVGERKRVCEPIKTQVNTPNAKTSHDDDDEDCGLQPNFNQCTCVSLSLCAKANY